jgi:Immunoglobulin I-set domain
MNRSVFLIGCLAAWILTACGGGGDSGDPGGTPPPPAPAASAALSPAATIAGPDGATLTLPEGALALPAPTVRLAKDASAAPPLPPAFAAAGDVFAVTPGATRLQVLGKLRIPADPATPDDTPVAIAESNDQGGWTLRTDARIEGSVLEIDVSRLGQYRVVRPADGAAVAARAGRKAALRLLPWTFGIRLTAPGFVDANLPVLSGSLSVVQRPTPFYGITRVEFLATPYSSRAGFCIRKPAIVVEYASFQGLALVPTGSETISADAGGNLVGTFPVHISKPVRGSNTTLASVTVQCVDASGAAYGVRAERMIRYDLDTSSIELLLSAPGFVNSTFTAGPTLGGGPFAFATTVPLTVQPFSTVPALSSACVSADAITIEYFDSAQPFGQPPISTQTVPIPALQPAPWTVDLRIFNASPAARGGYARITVNCADAGGQVQPVTGERLVIWLADDPAIGFFKHPVDVASSVGLGATFGVVVGGGPSAPTDRDQYRLFWERSGDGGATWQPAGTAYQRDANAAPPAEGRAHPLNLLGLTAADNGSRFRARACYAPPGQVERCVHSRSATLTVAQSGVAPVITRQPRSSATLVGDTASFDVAFTGTPDPAVRWQVQQSVAAGWIDVGAGGSPVLVTPPATLGANGWLYRAIVSNSAGSVTSDAVVWRITDTVVAPTITQQPVSVAQAAGGRVVFAITADGTAPLSYRWLKDGATLTGANRPVLTLDNVQAADAGAYRVVVSGPGGSASSDPASLAIVAGPALPTPPSIAVQPAPQTVPAGQAATFAATVVGGPPVACQWMRNGVAIAGATSCAAYTTPATTVADNGAVFNLVAYNAGGAVLAGGALLTVQGLAPSGRWAFLPSNTGTLLYDVAFVVPRDVIVAVGFDGRIRRSTDSGASWTVVYEGLDAMARPDPSRYLTKVRFADAQVGIAVGARTIVRTADGGATWREVLTQADVDGLVGNTSQNWQAVDWVDTNTAVVVGLSRVWRSTDRGATWQLHGSADFASLGVGNVSGLRFAGAAVGHAASAYRMLRTTDGGLTWSDVAPPFTLFTDPLYGVERGATNEWVAVGGDGIYRSTDDGLSWSRTAVSGLLGGTRYLSGLKARGREMVAVGDNGLVLTSNDAGAAWTAQPAVPFGTLWGVDFVANNGNRPIVVVGAGGLAAWLD